jgi:hypothetical protein
MESLSSFLSMVRQDALFPHECQGDHSIPLHLYLADWKQGLKPVGFIREGLGEALRANSTCSAPCCQSANNPRQLLVYHCKDATANAEQTGLQVDCWIVPAAVVNQGFEAITRHMKGVALICEELYRKRKITNSELPLSMVLVSNNNSSPVL